MSQAYRPFASYLRFKEVLADPMGHLYRAGEFDAGGFIRPVWLRVFDGPGVPTEDIIGELERARRIAEEVQSTSVAAGFDALVADGVPAIANDYTPSKPLAVVLERAAEERFPVPVDNALLILEKVSLALTATSTLEIDGERVVHGLLHPGLILVTHDGESQVTGFGIAPQLLALVDDAAAVDSIHPYLAPEVIRGRNPGRRGDVYSLGAILFHLLTGSALPPDVADRADALETARLDDGEVPLPDDIRALLQRSLAEQPEQRYSSAADFKKELDRLLYGGAYSPTTFNLALFMDRLFRAEIEAEEREMVAEQKVDISAYLDTAVETQPLMEELSEGPPPPSRRGLWIGLAAAAAVVAAVAIGTLLIGRGPSPASLTPTPTAEEIEAQRQAQETKMRELAEGLVAEMMAEKEQEIRKELSQRQAKIDELQRRLEDSERRARQGELSREEARKREELQRQIAAEEEAQRRQEADLAAERERAEEEARAQVGSQPVIAGGAAASGQAATPVGTEEAAAGAGAGEVPTARPTLEPTLVPTAPPTAPPTVPPTVVPAPAPTTTAPSPLVRTNDFVDPTEVDTLPVVIKEEPVVWPRSALTSRRQGVVILRATVNADGLVEEVTVLRADHDGFGIPQAASDAAMKYRFKPGMKDGVRIKTYATITEPYRFVMR